MTLEQQRQRNEQKKTVLAVVRCSTIFFIFVLFADLIRFELLLCTVMSIVIIMGAVLYFKQHKKNQTKQIAFVN